MDSLITAAALALAAGDPLAALTRVALREDAPALALRGIAMAQLGDRDAAPAHEDGARCARSGREPCADRPYPCAVGGGRKRLSRAEHARCAPDREWRGATPPARRGRSAAGVESVRRGRLPSCRAS